MSEPDDQLMIDVESEDELTFNGEQPDTSEDVESHSITNEVASEDPTTASAVSTDTGLGLLSLPPEVRLMVFRQLLLEHRPLSTYWLGSVYLPFPAILNTCRLIRQEAFEVMYGENVFFIGFPHPRLTLLHHRLIVDTIQNVRLDVFFNDPWHPSRRLRFIRTIQEFGSPAIVRNTLNVIVHVGNTNPQGLLLWYAGGLRRFTNFREIQIEFVPDPLRLHAVEDLCFILCGVCEDYLTPTFGPARDFADRRGVQFDPQSYLNSLPPIVYVDWMDYLDGIRLNWNSDPSTNAGETDASAQNLDSEA